MLEHNDKPHVTIKPGSRTLVIPNETKIIGVAGDGGAERIDFDLPRWYDGSDLGEKTWYVDVRNPLGQYDADMPDVLVDADMVHLEFVVRTAHAAQAGTVIIRLRATDAAGFTWQSEDGEFALRGSKIERGVPVPEPQITAIEQKLVEMEAVRQTVSAAGAQALADGQTAIATAAAAADDLAATALKTSASAPRFVASGNPVQVKAARKSALVVTASEDCTVRVCGQNLLPTCTLRTVTYNGVAVTQNSDGTYTFNGTLSNINIWLSGKWKASDAIFVLPPGTYTANRGIVLYRTVEHDYKENTFTLDEPFPVGGVRQNYVEGTVFENRVIYPCLAVGNSDVPYEPYTGATYTLTANTPTELQAPDSAVTNILASAGQLTVRYNRDTDDLLRALTCETTDTGATATLHPIRDAPIRARMEYEAAQEGTGDPSPDNVRSIRGTNAIGASTASKWAVVQKIVDAGLGPLAYPVGSQITAHHDIYGDVVFDVVAHDHHKNPDNAEAHTMTLLMHDCINGRMADNTEALYYCENGLSAGMYHFTLLADYDTTYGGGKTLQFVLSQPVPAGGVLMFPWAWNTQATATKISSYTSRESTTAIESVTVVEGSGGTNLGTADGKSANMNHAHRIRYGSNNWGESAVRQWLGSAAPANEWWHPQTIFDRPPSYANQPGFLAGFDDDFISVLGLTDLTTARNTVIEAEGITGGSYTTRDRVFLPSMAEAGLGNNDNIAEGSVMEFYGGVADADRIKYDIAAPTTARDWWLRSPYPQISYNVRFVTLAGALGAYIANNGYAIAAACVIYGSPQNTSVVDLPETVYGLPGAPAVYDSEMGIITDPTDCIASYNGEDVGSVWMSSTGALTTGAQVVYKLPTPRHIQAGQIELGGLDGETVVYSNGKRVTATSLEDPKYRAAQVNARLAALESAVTNQTI